MKPDKGENQLNRILKNQNFGGVIYILTCS